MTKGAVLAAFGAPVDISDVRGRQCAAATALLDAAGAMLSASM